MFGRHPVPAEQPATHVGERVARPDGKHDGERREPAVYGQLAHEQEEASPLPIQKAPITVAEIDAVGAWRVAEMPLIANASTNEVSAPPTIQSTPLICAPRSARMPPT